MDLDELQRHWNEWGRRDPYWAIVSRPDRRGNRWELGEFMKTGVDEIDEILAWISSIADVRRGRALDFGCGVGRLTQALAAQFAECDGVDIAPSMISRANELNRFGDTCRYHINDRDDLALFDDGVFDFVYSDIVLQHIAPEYSARYVREFARVLAFGGVAVFQLPSHPLAPDEDGPRPQSIADDAFRAEITPAATALELDCARISRLDVHVRNVSPSPWPSDRFLTLGNHWRRADGSLLDLDDGRAGFETTVEPGAGIDLSLEISAPSEPGDYLLELDLVVEGVAWFADRGSPTATIPVRVAAAATHTEPEILPVMEIHGIPRAEVETILREAGLDLLLVEETERAAGWRDYWYVATKPQASPRPARRLRALLGRH